MCPWICLQVFFSFCSYNINYCLSCLSGQVTVWKHEQPSTFLQEKKNFWAGILNIKNTPQNPQQTYNFNSGRKFTPEIIKIKPSKAQLKYTSQIKYTENASVGQCFNLYLKTVQSLESYRCNKCCLHRGINYPSSNRLL